MLLYRLGPEGFYAATDNAGVVRMLHSDPYAESPQEWRFGRPVDINSASLLVPFLVGKVVGIGRNYPAHARELDNPLPAEPVIFLKSPSSIIGPNASIVMPEESQRVEYEGEIAVVVRHTLRRATAQEARRGILGVTCACDVTARDLQRKDPTFARAKSFDTFCPLGPALRVDADFEDLEVVTRVDGEERQRGHCRDMLFGIVELLVYTSRMMTLQPGDVLLTGTPAGVGRLAAGQEIEVEVSGVGVLHNTVEAWGQG